MTNTGWTMQATLWGERNASGGSSGAYIANTTTDYGTDVANVLELARLAAMYNPGRRVTVEMVWVPAT